MVKRVFLQPFCERNNQLYIATKLVGSTSFWFVLFLILFFFLISYLDNLIFKRLLSLPRSFEKRKHKVTSKFGYE